MLENVTLAKKLMGGFITVAIITLIVGYAGYNGGNSLGNHIKDIGEVRLPGIESILVMQKELESLRVAQRTFLNAMLSDKIIKDKLKM